MKKKLAFVLLAAFASACANSPQESAVQTRTDYQDPHIWLEEVEGETALDWVRAENKITESELTSSVIYQEIYNESLAIMNSDERLVRVKVRGDKVYNYWRDATNVRGLYRVASLKDYLAGSPSWETVFDVDQLAKEHDKNWVFKGLTCLYPDNMRCLMRLSIGGADAVEVYEYDLAKRDFVENGFYLPEAKHNVSWKDIDHLYVGSDFGEGSLTDSGYPRIAKLWKRGTPLEQAVILYEGEQASVSVSAFRGFSKSGHADFVYEGTSFYSSDVYLVKGTTKHKLVKPDNASFAGFYNNQLFIKLKSDWSWQGKSFKQGSYIYAPMDTVSAGKPDYKLFVEPQSRKIINSVAFSENYIWVSWLDNVNGALDRFELTADNTWKTTSLALGNGGSISAYGFEESSDNFFVTHKSFVQPSTLYYVNGNDLTKQKLQQLPQLFDAENLVVEQRQVASKDGTMVPYFIVMPKDIELNGKNPTLLYGYGGFEVSMEPFYSGVVGKAWLERGGVYVLANIRGGGEFGPAWHQAALKQNRHKAYEDFEAIAQDLIAQKITSPKHLGAQGGSNGGLLMGNMLTRSPELFNAIVCQVPLLDMKRFNKLLAGASWMGEYGNPDNPEEWAFIQDFSPYHMLDEKKSYPKALITTSTRDDRVHPGHARKMVARLKEYGKDVLYYENMEGGHGGASNNQQRAHLYALVYSYLFQQLK